MIDRTKWQDAVVRAQESRVSLRDTFAAAALTGVLAQGDDGSFSEESYARAAYRWADVMLRERGDVSDMSKPISDERLAALEQLSALDQKWELKHGIKGNPMILAAAQPRNGAPSDCETVRYTLTDEEREAVLCAACYFDTRPDLRMQEFGSTLRLLLERLA